MSFEDSSSPGPAIRVDNLSKHYRVYSKPSFRLVESLSPRLRERLEKRGEIQVVRALDDVSFEASAGESLSILGSNGSGKSTLLQLLVGVLSPSLGSVRIDGRVSAILELGAGFNPEFSGRSNVYLNAKVLGLDPHADGFIDKVESFADLGSFFEAPVKTYSSGMYVRLAFSIAMMSRPDLLVIDEALAVGDMFFQQKCFDFLENELSDVAKILVTHDLASASRFSERCLVLHRGRLVFDGPILDGIQHYTAQTTRSYRSPSRKEVPKDVDPDVSTAPELKATDSEDTIEKEPNDGSPTEPVESASELFSVRSLVEARSGSRELSGGELSPVKFEDKIVVDIEFWCGVDLDEPIFGYFFRNRTGLYVFGYNSASAGDQLKPIRAGMNRIRVEFEWPDVEPGAYSFSVGLGDGVDPLVHHIVGWSQGVAVVECIASEAVHGLVNNPALFEQLDGER